jgi:DNA replication and repair protein RecF
LDEQLCHTGARLIRRRERVIAGLGELVDEAHGAIAGVPGKVGIRRVGPAAGDLTAAVEAARGDELRRGIVLVGPHRDDIELTLAGQPARAFASQGQARTLVLALKLAEVLAAARRGGDPPLFLLDDLTSELDRRRMERLVALLATLPHQVWITTTDPAWLGPLPAADTARLRVVEGTAAPG